MANKLTSAVANGDIIFWSVNVCNTGTELCKSASLKFLTDIPAGIELLYQGIPNQIPNTNNKGQYNYTEKVWYIGDLPANTCYTIDFQFKITDITLGDWMLQAQACSSCIESVTDNTSTLNIEVIEPCELINLKVGPKFGTTVSNGTSVKIG